MSDEKKTLNINGLKLTGTVVTNTVPAHKGTVFTLTEEEHQKLKESGAVNEHGHIMTPVSIENHEPKLMEDFSVSATRVVEGGSFGEFLDGLLTQPEANAKADEILEKFLDKVEAGTATEEDVAEALAAGAVWVSSRSTESGPGVEVTEMTFVGEKHDPET